MGVNILTAAKKKIGTGIKRNANPINAKKGSTHEYRLGGKGGAKSDTDGDGFMEIDCSGLVSDALKDAGYKIGITLSIFFMLNISSIATELAPTNELGLCSSMGYVKPKSFPILSEKPLEKSTKIARLHERQYLCIVDYDTTNKWAYITVDSDAFCNRYPQDTNCQGYNKIPERSYPVEWLNHTNNYAIECHTELLPEGTNYYPNWKYIGNCISGWIKQKDLIIINN